MLILVFRYRLINAAGVLPAGHYINVYWNDSTSLLEVYDYDDAADTTGTLLTSGPDIGIEDSNNDNTGDYQIFNSTKRGRQHNPIPWRSLYSFCQGNDLTYFSNKSTFPYADIKETENHASCSSIVCDLVISSYDVVDASDSLEADGAISINATSSNGTIKYSMTNRDFNYDTEGQTSNVFNNLLTGSYEIYAKDAIGCFAEITVLVGLPKNYGVLYRLEYTDRNDFPTRVDVLERGYTGDIIKVCGNEDPFILRYNHIDGLNKFKAVVPSEAIVTLMAEQNFFFINLFTQDERKYQVRYYKDFGEGSPETISISSLSSWLSTTGPGAEWATGSAPEVLVPGAVAFPHPASARSEILYTDYAFDEGSRYSITLSFTKTYMGTPGFESNPRTGRLMILNASNEVQFQATKDAPGGGPNSVDVTIEFTANSDSTRIGFVYSSGSLVEIVVNDVQGLQTSGYDIKWIGYVISSNYSEAYVATPYPVTIVATDGLADLQKADFLDISENKFVDDIVTIKAISEILKKTDLQLNIVTCVNRLEESMTSSALEESKFNADTFYHEDKTSKCLDALTHIIKPFGVRLYQRNGKWFIGPIEEAVHEFTFLEYDFNGAYITTGLLEDIKLIRNPIIEFEVAFTNRDQTLEIIPSYGKFYLEHTLLKNPSLVKSYSFEQSDMIESPEGLNTFRNWSVNMEEAPGGEFGIKETKSFEGDFNFFYKVSGGSISDQGATLTLTSAEGMIEYDVEDLFEYRFSYAVILAPSTQRARNPLWVRIKWSLRIGSYFFNANSGGWVLSPQYNDIYVDSFNDTQEFKVVAPFRGVTDLTLEDFQVDFVFTDERVVDFESVGGDYTDFDAITTVDKDPGYRIKGKVTYTNSRGQTTIKYLYWELSAEDTATNGLLTRRPTDYDVDDNQKVWVLVDEHIARRTSDRTNPLNDDPVGEFKVNYHYLDNVVLRHLPNGTEPPENITIERTNNRNIKVDYFDDFLLNDIDITNINNSERTYKNFFKKLDGTPTQVWERTYRAGAGKLLDLLSNDVLSQYSRQSNKLTGSFISDSEISYSTVLREMFDGGRAYMFLGYELHDKLYSVVFDLAELKDVINDDTEIPAGFTSGFSLGFNA